MKLLVAAIGKLKDDAEGVLIRRYKARIDALGRSHALGPVTIVELIEGRAGAAADRKADEAARLLAACRTAGGLVVLHEAGKTMSSRAFAEMIRTSRDNGTATLAFAVGGPDGHGADLLAATQTRLSLGPMTLPHGLARVVLLEQLYRAVTIIVGHPYHRD